MKSPYTDSLSHTTWECKYHIVFAPKFRRKEIYGELKQDIGMILRELCIRKEVLMDCDKDNPASSRTMIALGGKLIKEYYDDENVKCIVQDYIINVDEAIENNKEKYENKIYYKGVN